MSDQIATNGKDAKLGSGSDQASLAASAYAHWDRELRAFLYRRGRRDVEDISDLMQEVYLRVLRLRRIDLVSNPRAYLYGIAANVLSESNLRHRNSPVDFDSVVADAALERVQPTRASESGAQIQQQLRDALQRLPPTWQVIVLLERRDGLDHAAIAARLGLSQHTVKKYSVQALARLRASLDW